MPTPSVLAQPLTPLDRAMPYVLVTIWFLTLLAGAVTEWRRWRRGRP